MDDAKVLLICAQAGLAARLTRLLASSQPLVRVATNLADAREWLQTGRFNVALIDGAVPDLRVEEFASEVAALETPVAVLLLVHPGDEPAGTAGFHEIVELPISADLLAFQIASARRERALLRESQLLARLEARMSLPRGLVGHDPRMDKIIEAVKRLGRHPSPVLIKGERGTGRRRIGLAIHAARRPAGPLVEVSCRSLPDFVLDLELFGHPSDRLDFDGARGSGVLNDARGGVLLLKDIEALSARLQTKLISELNKYKSNDSESGPVPQGACPRLIATASTDIELRATKGAFKAELLDWVGRETIDVPSLHERSARHIARLIRLFERRLLATEPAGRPIPREELIVLARRRWPRNIPELRLAVESYVRAAGSDGDSSGDEPTGESATTRSGIVDFHPDEPLGEICSRVLASVERAYLIRVMTKYSGHVERVALHCGLSRRSIGDKLKKHGIDKSRYKRRPGSKSAPPGTA